MIHPDNAERHADAREDTNMHTETFVTEIDRTDDSRASQDVEYPNWLAWPEPGYVAVADVPGIMRRMARRCHALPDEITIRRTLAAVPLASGVTSTGAYRRKPKLCAHCQDAYIPANNRQRFCSKSCAGMDRNANRAKAREGVA